MAKSKYVDENGNELLDPTPVAVPLNWKRPPTLQEQVARLFKAELSRQAMASGHETFEEADDFDVDDDHHIDSPYEEDFEHEERLASDFAKELARNKKSAEPSPDPAPKPV